MGSPPVSRNSDRASTPGPYGCSNSELDCNLPLKTVRHRVSYPISIPVEPTATIIKCWTGISWLSSSQLRRCSPSPPVPASSMSSRALSPEANERACFRPLAPSSEDRSCRRSFTTCAVSSLLRQVGVGQGVPLPRPRIQVVHGTVPQKCARNALPAPSGIPSRPALGELRCHPLPTSSTRAPEVTPN
jgi:hypothetical protein